MSFNLDPTFIESFKDRTVNWGPVGYLVYKREYSYNNEEWWQTCQRVVEGCYSIQKDHCTDNEIPWVEDRAQRSAQEMYERMFDLKWLPPGRGLRNMGTPIVGLKGGAVLNNCAFVSTKDIDSNFSEPFCWLMDMSMLGVGVGSDTLGAGKVTYCPDFVRLCLSYSVADSREGWISIVATLLEGVVTGLIPGKIDFGRIRPKGTPLKGMGGVASGPGPLMDLCENLINLYWPKVVVTRGQDLLVLKDIYNRTSKTRSVTSDIIVDTFNLIGACVVSGGIRRTAEIMLGGHDDLDFLDLKTDQEKLMSHRWASNNSIIVRDGDRVDWNEIGQRIRNNGEPGIFWLDRSRQYGRLADEANFLDNEAMGTNPCSEQTLHDRELCCLVETFPANHESAYDFRRTLKFAYLYGKTVTLVPTHDKKTWGVIQRNRRIGTSQSGIQQAIAKFGLGTYLEEFCDTGYKFVCMYDEIYSKWLRVPKSIKKTSVKPSGTVSLLCGATPGIHHAHSEYYIRRIQLSDTSELIDQLRGQGYKIEPYKYGTGAVVVEIPIHEKHFTKGKDDVSAWEQTLMAVLMQEYWADNQVSITVTFKPDESVESILEILGSKLKSISFLPLTDHGYEQAPYEKITAEEYVEPKPLNNLVSHDRSEDKSFCDSDSCTI